MGVIYVCDKCRKSSPEGVNAGVLPPGWLTVLKDGHHLIKCADHTDWSLGRLRPVTDRIEREKA